MYCRPAEKHRRKIGELMTREKDYAFLFKQILLVSAQMILFLARQSPTITTSYHPGALFTVPLAAVSAHMSQCGVHRLPARPDE